MSTLLAPPTTRPLATPPPDATAARKTGRVPASHDAGARTAAPLAGAGDGATLDPARLTIAALAATRENLPRQAGAPAGPPARVGSPGDEPGLVAGDTNPAAVYLARLAPTGRRVQATALSQIAALVTDGAADAWSMPWHRLTYAHTHAVRAHVAARYAPATANRMLAALRGVLREAWRLGLMDSEQYQRATDLAAVRGQRLPAGRAVTAGELTALFASCPPTPGGVRDAALIAVLYGTGVRRSEAAALDVADIDLATAAVTINNGKGAKSRLTYLPAGALAALTAWLDVRGSAPGRCSCLSAAADTSTPATGSAAKPSAPSCTAAPQSLGSRRSAPTTCAAPRSGTCWTPARTSPRSLASRATPRSPSR